MEPEVGKERATTLSELSKETRIMYLRHAFVAMHEESPEDWIGAESLSDQTIKSLSELQDAGLLHGAWIGIRLNGPILKPTYQEYLESDHWKECAEFAKHEAGQRCQVCNVHRDDAILDAHHRTYERMGNENPQDITVLCRECHTLFHEHRRIVRPG